MSGSRVAEIRKDATDPTGNVVETVYSKIDDTYAVYRTRERVVVHYADDAALARDQRLALCPLNPLRGEINGLIDGWRVSDRYDKKAKATLFDRRVADALIVALQGDQRHALELLTALKADVLEERTSVARTEYLLIASGSVVALIVIFGLLTGSWLSSALNRFVTENQLWLAAGGGAVGALFSIGLAIRNRSILTDLQSRDNAVDAILRILIGAISAIVLFSLLRSELVAFDVAGTSFSLDTIHAAIVVAFVAGFSERLVGNLLDKAALTGAGSAASNPLAGTASVQSAGRGPAEQADERNPLGRGRARSAAANAPASEAPGATSASEEDDLDCCVADVELGMGDITLDIELPEASGGVTKAAA